MLPVKCSVSPVPGLRMVEVSGPVTFCTTAADDVAGTSQSTAARNRPGSKRLMYFPLKHPLASGDADKLSLFIRVEGRLNGLFGLHTDEDQEHESGSGFPPPQAAHQLHTTPPHLPPAPLTP